MQPIQLKDPAGFAEEFLRLSLMQGFGSLNKRDLELLTFVLLERDGAIPRDSSNAAAALQLRITATRVKSLRRDGYARWRALVPEEPDAALQRIVATVLTEDNLRSAPSTSVSAPRRRASSPSASSIPTMRSSSNRPFSRSARCRCTSATARWSRCASTRC